MSKKTLTITDNRTGKTFDFEIKNGSCGPAVADLTTFYDKTGMFVYDPGFKSTASCSSSVPVRLVLVVLVARIPLRTHASA